MADSQGETLAIPEAVRREVRERDGEHCRVCGRYDDSLALHHVEFGGDARGMGGRRVHDPAKIISVGWLWGHRCHDLLHGRKLYWMPYALDVVNHPGVTVFQLERWARRRLAQDRRFRGC